MDAKSIARLNRLAVHVSILASVVASLRMMLDRMELEVNSLQTILEENNDDNG